MMVNLRSNVVDGQLLKWLFAAGAAWLEHHKQQVNNMNVFPVPDGDTGENMLATIRMACKQVADAHDEHIGIVMNKIAHGALRGARGNSGTILSMLLAGFAKAVQEVEQLDARTFAHAMNDAVEHTYREVRKGMDPVEGTILTVARESAEALVDRAHTEDNLNILLTEMIVAARQSLENTPNLLPKLKEAGVVDSGGMGLVYILEGMKRLTEGKPVSYPQNDGHSNGASNPATAQKWQDALVPDEEDGYGYDVQFLMIGENLDVDRVRADITAMGWSPLVHGDDSMIKVHIHVYDPGEPLSYAIKQGAEIDDIVVENMQAQYLEYVQERQGREDLNSDEEPQISEGVAVIAVARGEGLRRLFREYGAARIIVGGQTMNPSTEDFVQAIESLETDEIVILPNNGNVIMAAQQAAEISAKQVRVVRSKTMQQGIAALLSYLDWRDDGNVDDVHGAMQEHLQMVVSAEITTATRDVRINDVDVQMGKTIAMLEGQLVASGESVTDMVHEVLAVADVDSYELVTLFYGEGISQHDAERLVDALATIHPDLEFEIVNGGQPLYPYLISIE